MKRYALSLVVLCAGATLLTGCAGNTKLIDSLTIENDKLRSQIMEYEDNLDALAASEAALQNAVATLQRQIDELNAHNEALKTTVVEVKDEKSSILKTKEDLEEQLKKEISNYQAKLEMTEKGLVVSFLAEILFDSGKDEVKAGGVQALGKVATILRDNKIDNMIAIEGHTDNVPIKYSGWKSNWELSAARALSVLHYFVDECGMDPRQVSAIAYSEFQPRSPNLTEDGKKQNRRVEIVILPKLKREDN